MKFYRFFDNFDLFPDFFLSYFIIFSFSLALQAGVTGAAMSGVVAGEGHRGHTSIPVLHAGSHFRHGLLQLMIHTIDPLHDGKTANFHFLEILCI